MKTYLPKVDEIERCWYLLDAEAQILGRLATRVASILMGKGKPIYTDFIDTGDFVVIVNAEKIQLTGNKLDDKKYYRHSGYPGALKEINSRRLLEKKPEKVIELAVRRMLPKNKLGRRMLKRLKVYAGSEHPHQAQQPQSMSL
jgi:large subunit ribosomal protein L13